MISAVVKLKGARYAVPVLVDASLGDPRMVAENVLGPLASFKVLSVDTAAHVTVAANPAPVTYFDQPRQPDPIDRPCIATRLVTPEEVYRLVVANMGDMDWPDTKAAGTEAAGRWLALMRANASITQLSYPPFDHSATA